MGTNWYEGYDADYLVGLYVEFWQMQSIDDHEMVGDVLHNKHGYTDDQLDAMIDDVEINL